MTGRVPWFPALRERLARRIAPWHYGELWDAVTLAGGLPIGVPEARYDDLLRLDALHRRLGVLPPRAANSQPVSRP